MKTFALPDLGEGLTEAEIVAWHVAAGDHVVADQPLVSVETAKAVVEIPAPWSGRVTRTFGAPHDVIGIGAPLVEIETEGGATETGAVVGALPNSSGAPPTAARRDRDVVKVSPAVRRRAAELGVELGDMRGAGPGGTITIADVEARGVEGRRSDGYVALGGVRRSMAEAMARAGAEIVGASVTEEAIIEGWGGNADPTVRLIKAVVAGCRAAPALNAWFDAKSRSRRLHDVVDLGVAMETADGLFVPVLRDAGSLSDGELRERVEGVKQAVRQRSVGVGELRNQTITLSNFGMLGGLNAVLTILPPQVAILGAGRIHRAPRVVGDDIRAVRVLPLSLTFDHRVVTGAEAMRFLSAVVADLET